MKVGSTKIHQIEIINLLFIGLAQQENYLLFGLYDYCHNNTYQSRNFHLFSVNLYNCIKILWRYASNFLISNKKSYCMLRWQRLSPN